MKKRSPPRLALALLDRFGPQDDILAGDLVEEFERGRSRRWFWRQALLAAASGTARDDREVRPLRLLEDDSPAGLIGPRRHPRRADIRRPVNITASPVAGVGGLGLAILLALVTWIVPQFWWIIAVTVAAGIAAGALMLAAKRHRIATHPAAASTMLLTREAVDDRSSSSPEIDRRR
jgi:hypothetical protein